MDPNACLARFLSAAGDGDRDEAIAALDDLKTWLAAGGALPSDPRAVVDEAEMTVTAEASVMRLALPIATYVLHAASGRCPGEPIGINLDDLQSYVENELSLPEGEPDAAALLVAMPVAEEIVRKRHPRAVAAWVDRRPSTVKEVIWAGI
jgi:hypothetical protein